MRSLLTTDSPNFFLEVYVYCYKQMFIQNYLIVNYSLRSLVLYCCMGVLNNGHYYLKCLTILLKELLWVVQILLLLLNFYGYLPCKHIPFDDFGANFFNVSKLRNANLRSGKLSVIYRIGSAPHFFFQCE